MGKVTIEDISRLTGLSRGTVSRALNDRPDISEETKRRVLEACQQLKYVPSHAARALATGRRYAVAVLLDDLRRGFAASIVRGVAVRARSQRLAVHASDLAGNAEQAVEHVRMLVSERVDAVLLAVQLPPELLKRLLEALNGRPMVTVQPLAGARCDVLGPDYVESGRLAARHVLPKAGPNILYVHQPGDAGADLRRLGFEEVCRGAGLDPAEVVVEVERSEASADRLEVVRSRLGGLRALVASNDFLAVDLMLMCSREGRIPGRDIAVIGQGNEAVGLAIWPTLTTIEYAGEEVGARALELALQRVTKTRQDSPQEILVAPSLVLRESSRMLG